MVKVKQKYLKVGGIILVILSFLFIGRMLYKMDLASLAGRFSLELLLVLIIGGLFYIFLILLFAMNWTLLLALFSGLTVIRGASIAVYLKTLVAKYLPSNLMHFAGRHLVTRQGHSNGAVLAANLAELLLLVGAASVIVISAYLGGTIELPAEIGELAAKYRYLFLGLAIAGGIAGGIIVIRLGVKRFSQYVKDRLNWGGICKAAGIALLYLPFFIITGTILQILLWTAGEGGLGDGRTFYVIAAFALSWAAGFIIPGAPGGLGVRELVMLLLLSPLYERETVMIAALSLRLITISGDVGAFLCSRFFESYGGLNVKADE